jgi:hypothetical protein
MNDVPIPKSIQQIEQREQAETGAYNQIFNEVMGGHPPSLIDRARPAFRAVDSCAESVQDQAIAARSVVNHDAASGHVRDLEREADKFIAGGHIDAAEHLLRRHLRFSVQTLGLDDQWSKRLAAEVKTIDQFLKVPPLQL